MKPKKPETTVPAGSSVTVDITQDNQKITAVEWHQEDDPENDPVNHPSHYTTGKIECIDYILDKELDFCRGNAVKYITRAGRKDPDKEIEDLEKAVFYLNREIARLKEAKANGGN